MIGDEILWEQLVDLVAHGQDVLYVRVNCPEGWEMSDVFSLKVPDGLPRKVRIEGCQFIIPPREDEQ